jgi:TonB-linked SusC/RagA family outer membrane protein
MVFEADCMPWREIQGMVTKTFRIMRITALLMLAACLQVSARGTAQTVTLAEKNVPLQRIFKEIHRQTGFQFFYQDEVLKQAGLVTIEVRDAPVEDVLAQCFQRLPITYSIVGTAIVVRVKEEGVPGKVDTTAPGAGGPIRVKGVVYNESNQPLAGANVTVKETERGTITNAGGEFVLIGVPLNSDLVVSFVGYAPQNIKVQQNSITNLKIYLKVAKDELDKVVIQAYGTTTQRLATGNIGTVTAEDIAKQPVINPLEVLQGAVPGAVVTNDGGYASGTVKVEIRGRNTINPNFPSDPLYIIDGVPLTIQELTSNSNYGTGSQGVIQTPFMGSPAEGQSPFFSMNPDDIESISVLKDADATAIYGSRGSNGVILITTKKGKVGKTKLNLNVQQGVNQTPRYYHMLNTQQYVAMRREALNNDGLPININTAPDLVAWDTARYTNWQKYLWGGLGKLTDVRANLSGGDIQTTFRLSAEYLHQMDILNYSGANQRGSLDFNLNHKSQNQRLSIVLSGFYSIAATNQINVPSAIALPPNAPPIFDGQGNLNFAGWAPLDNYFPFGSYLQPYSSKTNFLNSSLVLSYALTKGLTFRTNLGYNNITTLQSRFYTIAAQDPKNQTTGISQFGNTFIYNVILEPQIEYGSYIGKGKFDILVGASSQANNTSSDYLSGSGYTSDPLLSNLSAAPSQYEVNSGGQYKYAALFGRVNYNWQNEFIVNVNARRDGSSRFGPGRQYGNFGSVGVAWVFSEEDWVKRNLRLLSFGKLRGSYGTVGGDQVGNYAYLSLWSYQPGAYNGVLPATPNGLTDSLLQWQVNRKAEAAIDFGFLKDRITVEVSWYRDRTNNQLVAFPTPSFTGFSSVTANSPANVQNQGLEISASGKILEANGWTLTSKFSIGMNRNKLLGYPDLAQSPYAGLLIVGQPLNIKRAIHYSGIDPQTGEYTFQDRNHDGQITYDYSGETSDDSYPIDMSTKFDGSLTTNVGFNHLELSLFFYFRRQLGINALYTLPPPGNIGNQPVSVLNRWQKPGDITSTPKFTTQTPPLFYQYYQSLSDATIDDASFIRLQNVALSYSLSSSLAKKAGLGQLKIFVEGHNLFILTKYNGLDPETQSFSGLPRPRTIVTGITCEF